MGLTSPRTVFAAERLTQLDVHQSRLVFVCYFDNQQSRGSTSGSSLLNAGPLGYSTLGVNLSRGGQTLSTGYCVTCHKFKRALAYAVPMPVPAESLVVCANPVRFACSVQLLQIRLVAGVGFEPTTFGL